MNMKFSFLIFIIIFSFPTYALDTEFDRVKIKGDWQKILEEDGVQIFLAEVPDSKFKAFRSKGIVKGNIEKYLALFREVGEMKKWSPKIIEKIVITEVSDIEAVTYQIDDIPWPAQDRDLILNNKLFFDKDEKTLKVLLHSVEDSRFPPKKDYIRAQVNWAVFSIRPHTKDTTYIDFMIHADPRGEIPAWIVNQIQRKWPLKFLKNSEKAVETFSLPVRPGVLMLYKQLQDLSP
jgi:START domain